MAAPIIRPALLALLAAAVIPGASRAGWDIELIDLYTQRYDPGGNGPRAATFLPKEKFQAVCTYRYSSVGKEGTFKPWRGVWTSDGQGVWPPFKGEDPGPKPVPGQKTYRLVTDGLFVKPGQHHIGCRLNPLSPPELPEDNPNNNSRTISVTVLPPPSNVGDTGKAQTVPATPRIPPGPITAGIPGPKSGMQAIPPGARPELVFDPAVSVGGVQGQWGGAITVGESAASSRGSGTCQFKLASAIRNAGQLPAGPFNVSTQTSGRVSLGASGLAAGGSYPFALDVTLRPGANTVRFRLYRVKDASEPAEKERIASVSVHVAGSCIGMLPPAPSPTPPLSRK